MTCLTCHIIGPNCILAHHGEPRRPDRTLLTSASETLLVSSGASSVNLLPSSSLTRAKSSASFDLSSLLAASSFLWVFRSAIKCWAAVLITTDLVMPEHLVVGWRAFPLMLLPNTFPLAHGNTASSISISLLRLSRYRFSVTLCVILRFDGRRL